MKEEMESSGQLGLSSPDLRGIGTALTSPRGQDGTILCPDSILVYDVAACCFSYANHTYAHYRESAIVFYTKTVHFYDYHHSSPHGTPFVGLRGLSIFQKNVFSTKQFFYS